MDLHDFRQRIWSLFSRGVLTNKDGSGKIRKVQTELYLGDVRENVEHFEPYGFTSEPFTGAETLTMSIDGDRCHTIAICVADRRYRLKGLKDGEVAIFDDQKQMVKLSRDGIDVETPKDIRVKVSGNASVIVGGDATVNVANQTTLTCPTVTANASSGITFNTPILKVSGLIQGAGGLTISGGSGALVNGSLTTTGDVVANGISLEGHTHGGVESGPSNTGAPQ